MGRTCLRFALVLTLFAGIATLLMLACGNGANDVTGCRQLEDARCSRAMECGVDLGLPLHAGGSAADAVTACQEFYQDACLHGFATTINITGNDLPGCLKAITTGSCDAVVNPQRQPACSWLIPPDAGVDAGVDTGTPDVVVIVIQPVPDAEADTGLESCEATCDMTCEGDPNCIDNCATTCEGN
jgi:hypothetical protein